MSTLSFYGLEKPIRRGKVLLSTRALVATPAAVIGTVVVVVLTTVSPAGAVPPLTTPTTSVGNSPTSIPAFVVDAPVRVMLVGDSTALTLGLGLGQDEKRWHINIDNLGTLGCGVALGTWLWTTSQGQLLEQRTAPPCSPQPEAGYVPWTAAWPKWLREVRPNLVVLLAGRWEVLDRLFEGRRTNILDPGFAGYVKHMLKQAVTIGTSTGAHMVLMTAPCYSSGEQANGAPWPQDDVRRVQVYNRLVKEVGAEFPDQVTVQDLYSLACPNGKYRSTFENGVLRDSDGVHFSLLPGTGGELLAPTLLPLWEDLGHRQEASGGKVVTGPLPTYVSPA